MILTTLRKHAMATVTSPSHTVAKGQLMGSRSQTATDTPTCSKIPPYHCQNAIACFSKAVSAGAGPVSPELIMQPLTPDGSLPEGLSMPTARAPGRSERSPHSDALPGLDGRGAEEAFCRQDRQWGANAGHTARGQGKPSTYCQILN